MAKSTHNRPASTRESNARQTNRPPQIVQTVQQSMQQLKGRRRSSGLQNVGNPERAISIAAGAILAGLGLRRRDAAGIFIAGVGSALAFRGITGHCSLYQALGASTCPCDADRDDGVEVSASFLINKPAEVLYSFWRHFENLPKFMSHLESVSELDRGRSHWVAKAPAIYGGKVEWDAEITADEPNKLIRWRSLPGADIEHRGSIQFRKALGDRGTNVRVEMEYRPPAGKLGQWVAKLFHEEPKQQIHDDLRRFKRLMEAGDILTILGQPRGTCTGRGVRES